jgi:hypothetical protein
LVADTLHPGGMRQRCQLQLTDPPSLYRAGVADDEAEQDEETIGRYRLERKNVLIGSLVVRVGIQPGLNLGFDELI